MPLCCKIQWCSIHTGIYNIGCLFIFQSKHRTFKAFSSELIIAYNKLKESGRNFEIIYVNCDKDERAWQEYVENIPWLALPFADEHTMDLIAALDVTRKKVKLCDCAVNYIAAITISSLTDRNINLLSSLVCLSTIIHDSHTKPICCLMRLKSHYKGV